MKLDGKTTMELLDMQKQIEADPRNKSSGLYLYTKEARKKLDAIARAITSNMAEQRAAEGRPVPTNGYSGRQTNRRR